MIETNYLSPSKATELIRRIEKVWRRRGYDGIEVWTEPLGMQPHDFADDTRKHCESWVVIRSNIGPWGFPPIRKTFTAKSKAA